MSKNPFIILGISENATRDEAYEAYRTLRARFEDKRFAPGEEGAEACARLEEIEAAYSDVCEIISERDSGGTKTDYRTQYTEKNLDDADNAIRENRIDDAQRYLDNCTTRTARWHYLQSAIFYRKNWTADALKQLELACNMEPSNAKYRDAKVAMEKHIKANTTAQENSFYNNGARQERSYADSTQYQHNRRGCSVCDACSGLICADCCCECMGGDCISCC